MNHNSAPVNCIMLIDDNKIDNFFHERVIRKSASATHVLIKESGEEALLHLKDSAQLQPDIIFLDINMPGMNGWEFIAHYKKMDAEMSNCMIVVMLTTSENPDDVARAKNHGVLAGFKSKPLTNDMLAEVIATYRNRLKNEEAETF